MSALRGDARLRSLERAAAAGDVEAQARQLAERVRAGTLTRERLELAAYCGDAGARMALNVEDRASWPACGCEGGYGEDGPGACLSDGPIARLLRAGLLAWALGPDPELERLRAGLLAWALGPDPELGNVADTPKRLAPYLHPTHIDPDPELPPTPVAALDGGGDA